MRPEAFGEARPPPEGEVIGNHGDQQRAGLMRKDRLYSHQNGNTLLEMIVSMALIAILVPVLLLCLVALAGGQGRHSERVGALIAVRSQLEAVKKAAYDTSVTTAPGPAYSSLPTSRTVGDIPFGLSIAAQEMETDVQLVTVVASTDGVEIVQLQYLKVNR